MEEPAPAKEDNGNILAWLCYIPFFAINLIVIAYVLVTGKGGRLAKFHALQGLLFYVAYFLVIMLLVPAFFFSGNVNIMAIPLIAAMVIYLGLSLYIAYRVSQKRDTRIPIIGNIASNFVK